MKFTLCKMFGRDGKHFPWTQLQAVLSASLLAIVTGINIGWSSPSIMKIASGDLGFTVKENELSFIVMILPTGFLIGAPLAGYLLDKIGRKNTMLYMVIPQTVAWILIAVANNTIVLCVGRFTAGIADGALFTALPIYISEILEPRIRGTIGVCHSVMLTIGVLLINCYGSYLSIRTAAYITLTIPFLFLMAFIWMPESPYYFLMKKRMDDARQSLRRLRTDTDVENELSKITTDVERQMSEPSTLKAILTTKFNLMVLTIISGLQTIQETSGLTGLVIYSQVIFEQAGGKLSAAESAIICSAIQVLAASFSSILMDKCGRRPLIIFSTLTCSVILLSLGTYYTLQEDEVEMPYLWWLPSAGTILYNLAGPVGILVVPNLMMGELLSISIRAKALGILNICYGISTCVEILVFHWLDHDYGIKMPFLVFGSCSFVGAAFCYCYVPETKGKRLEEIQEDLLGPDAFKRRASETKL